MNTTPSILESQIQRLMLNKSERKRLLDELKSLSQERLNQLAELIQEHDEEALKVLSEKAREQNETHQKFIENAGIPSEKLSEAEVKDVLGIVENAFKNPNQLADVIALSDDSFLLQVEQVIVDSLQKPEQKEEFRRFFHEVRLQKAAVEKEVQAEQKEKLIEAILQIEEQSRQLDALIRQAETVLGK